MKPTTSRLLSSLTALILITACWAHASHDKSHDSNGMGFLSESPAIASFIGTFLSSCASLVAVLFVPTSVGRKTGKPTIWLSILVGFACGGIMGDVFLHLLPHVYERMSHDDHHHDHEHHSHSMTPGFLVISGVLAFFLVEKAARYLTGSGHHHAHADSDADSDDEVVINNPKLRHRKRVKSEENAPVSQTIHPAVYLNLIADGVHNFTDGMAVAAAFYTSGPSGIAATLAVFLHELPQEIGDFFLLLQWGLPRKKAILWNFASAMTAMLGNALVVLLGTWIEDSLSPIVAIAAGGFLYIALVDIIPEMQENSGVNGGSTWANVVQIASVVCGVLLLALLAFLE